MSVQAVAWVLEHSTSRLGARLALLSIANHAHPDGTQSYPSYDTIAKEARLSRRQAVRAVATLVDDGHISSEAKASPFGTNVYTILGLAPSDNLSPTAGGKGRWVVTNPASDTVTSPTLPSDISVWNGVTDVTRTVLELTVQQPPEGQPAAGKPATNGHAKGKRLEDLLNIELVEALHARYDDKNPAWRRVTNGWLSSLVFGSERRKIPAYGARAVNAAIDALYENSASVSDPAGYLRRVCEEVGL